MKPGRPRKDQGKLKNAPPGNTEVVTSPAYHNPDQEYWCTRCPRRYKVQKTNFYASQSPLYKYNGGYLTVCRHCIDDLHSYYTTLLGDEVTAIQRICQMFDMYFSEQVVEWAKNKSASGCTLISAYISAVNLRQHKGKTFDDYIFEEKDRAKREKELYSPTKGITQKTKKFFGQGFTDDEYVYLSEQYNDWIERYECETKAQEELFKTICFSQLNMLKAQQSGVKPVEAYKAFQDLLGSANIKPTQSKDNSLADQNTFGTLIQKWENEKPIPEPAEEWKDVDGIKHYISAWFFGHLAKMFKIPNDYSSEYDKEKAKYTVSQPEYSDEEAMADVFAVLNEDGTSDG